MLDREMVLRRARGYAPLPIRVGARSTASQTPSPNGDAVERVPTILAVGAHLKNSVALAVGDQVFISQHIGDLETEQANSAFRRAAADLPRLYDAQPEVLAADLHPDYLSTQFALERRPPARHEPDSAAAQRAGSETSAPRVIRVQHHIAHVLSCIAENEVELPALGVAWDGTGYGSDGTIWGGEFFLITEANAERVASLRPFRLPGGVAAVKEPRRAVLGLLHELANSDANLLLQVKSLLAARFAPPELATLETMLLRGVNSPFCSSIGRLFDAVAALLGLRQQMQFDGQAAMELEFATEGVVTDAAYKIPLTDSHSPMRLDWASMIEAMLVDVAHDVAVGEISAKFHNTLAEAIVTVAGRVGERRVALGGGCFQNRYLTGRAVTRLREEGFQPYWPQRVPPNDGGIALGQVVAARRELAGRGAAFTPLQQPNYEPLSDSRDSSLVTLKRAEARAPLSHITHHASR
jgi:hydrogenase maturation protein HypF